MIQNHIFTRKNLRDDKYNNMKEMARRMNTMKDYL